jgi:poly(ADP-ribose) glycohydrolase ARH3
MRTGTAAGSGLGPYLGSLYSLVRVDCRVGDEMRALEEYVVALREDLVTGGLLGLACGDALGAPFEGATRVARPILSQWETTNRQLRYTDDGAMAIVLTEHLCRHSGLVHDDELVLDFARAWRREPGRGYGAGPPAIFRMSLAGGDWRSLARGLFSGAGSYGNGGAMRTAPVASVPGPVATRVLRARQQAAVTHTNVLAQEGAALQCAAVALSAETADRALDPELFLDGIRAHVETPEFREALQGVQVAVRRGWTPHEVAAHLGNDISAVGSVPSALASFLLNPDEPRQAVLSAIQMGGDTDTIAAMTGAIAGARCGEAGLPRSWVRRLERAGEIRDLAGSLAAMGNQR